MAKFSDALTGALPARIDTDVCIMGAGMAGITIASGLAGTKRKVLMLESGGLGLEGATQSLYQGKQLGIPYYDLTACRLRYFGGTSNHWGGYCRPNDAIDYEGRPDLGLPAWPINDKDLAPYIAKAAERLGFPDGGFDPRYHLKRAGIKGAHLVDERTDKVVTKVFQISRKRRFSELYKESIDAQTNLEVLTHANVTHIQLTHNGAAVDHVVVKTLAGKVFKVYAKTFVLACHAIENARLLLASNDVQTSGIGNKSDQVGRNFMDHVYVKGGAFVPTKGVFSKLYNHNFQKAKKLNFNLGFSDAVLRKEGLLQYYCRFWPKNEGQDELEALGRLYDGFFQPFQPDLVSDLMEVVSSPLETAEAVGQLTGKLEPKLYELDHRIEQAPNPESRVLLSRERDALGNQRADLRWELGRVDFETFQKGQKLVAGALSAAGYGRFNLENLSPEFIRANAKGHYHHIGTTKMSHSPNDGVVDRDCKVHGVANLYVAGSSVFPTAGYSGPTMMLMALGIRIAEHLARA